MIISGLFFLIIMTGIGVIIWQQHIFYKNQLAREKEFKAWLFEALYTIDSKVMLPPDRPKDEPKKEASKVKGSVYSPLKDPMNRIKGHASDYYEG